MYLKLVRMKGHKYYKMIFEKYKNINYRFKNFKFLENRFSIFKNIYKNRF